MSSAAPRQHRSPTKYRPAKCACTNSLRNTRARCQSRGDAPRGVGQRAPARGAVLLGAAGGLLAARRGVLARLRLQRRKVRAPVSFGPSLEPLVGHVGAAPRDEARPGAEQRQQREEHGVDRAAARPEKPENAERKRRGALERGETGNDCVGRHSRDDDAEQPHADEEPAAPHVRGARFCGSLGRAGVSPGSAGGRLALLGGAHLGRDDGRRSGRPT